MSNAERRARSVGLRRWAALAATLVGTFGGAASASAAPQPAISGALPGEPGALFTTTFDLDQLGYTQSEHFMTGTARSYLPNAPLTPDGYWSVAPAESAAYKTRIVVYRPKPAKFNGTVYVSWLNVSIGSDGAFDWLSAHTEILRQGAAFVLVSAQKVGVDAARTIDPARYGSLTQPSDSFSYDIFSQAGQTLESDPSLLLGKLKPKRLIAVGESQSANRLNTYVNAVQPLEKLFDGFFLWSRIGAGPGTNRPAYPLSQPPQADVPAPLGTRVRADQVPVLDFYTETDAEGLPANSLAQPDSHLYRAWGVTAAGHADAYQVIWQGDTGRRGDLLDTAQATFDSMITPVTTLPNGTFCPAGIVPTVMHYVSEGGFRQLDRWVRTGVAPASAPRFEFTQLSPDAAITPQQFAVDANGIARGGIRTPFTDAPIATIAGRRATPDLPCRLFGFTTPFSQSRLDELYPTHQSFVRKWRHETAEAIERGWIVPEQKNPLNKVAAHSAIGQ